MISARILKGDEGPHLSPGGVVRGAALHAVAEPLQRGGCLLQTIFILDLEPDGLIAWVAFGVAKRMLSVVRSEIERFFTALRDLQAQAACRKALRRCHIRGPEANIADVFQLDHASSPGVSRLAHARTQLRHVL